MIDLLQFKINNIPCLIMFSTNGNGKDKEYIIYFQFN